MKRKTITHAARLLCVLALAMTMTTAAFAADLSSPVIKCKKRPRKKCSFVAEMKGKR